MVTPDASDSHLPDGDDQRDPSRRAFLTGAGATALAGLAAACSADSEPDESAEPAAPTAAATAAATASVAAVAEDIPAVGFAGAHQAGILAPPAAAGIVASFDAITTDRTELAETFEAVSNEIARLMSGDPIDPADGFLPPADSGAIGAESTTAGVAVTMAVGASLFDDRFGLGDRRPRELITMPRFFNDRLVRPELSDGDLSFTISGPNQQAVVFALHQLVRVSQRQLRLRWVQEGYNQLLAPAPDQVAPSRNLMGFRDGTSNLDTSDLDTMDRHVWIQPGDDEPDWAIGGSYQAARVIRMLIEFWATAALVRQEQIFGRHRDTGAPLGQDTEAEVPSFVGNPGDDTIPQRAHMRLANPRTPGAARILRRGFSYLNGAAGDGTLDQGLLFLCYQRSLRRGFLEVQSRLDGEPLEDYIKPVGGGLFFVLPGPGEATATEPGWLGQSLFS